VLVDDPHEARIPALVVALRPGFGVGGREEEHVAAFDERAVVVVDPVAHEALVDPVREAPGVEAVLQAPAAFVVEAHPAIVVRQRRSSSRRTVQTSSKPIRRRIG